MNWLFELPQTNPTAQAIAILSLVCVAGMSLGSIRIRGIKLGPSGVLFAAILAGHISEPVDHQTLEFVKEFGLILFVFCIGLQLGPGFFASFRQAGFQLNLLALGTVALGALVSVGLGRLWGLDGGAVLGIFSGATTNTPSLGAAQQALSSLPNLPAERAALPALAYAVTYPLGIVGIMGSLLAIRWLFRVDVAHEVETYLASQQTDSPPLERRTLVVENQNLSGLPIREIPALAETGVVVSRLRHNGANVVSIASSESVIRPGDCILVVGSGRGLDQFQRVVGRPTHDNLLSPASGVIHRRVVVTNPEVLGKTVKDLGLDLRFGVIVTRIVRGDLEMTPLPSFGLQFGDVLQVVGSPEDIRRASQLLGNSVQALRETHFVPLFAGIALGIALGTMPIFISGLPQPLRIGLAGGPLIVAIIVGRFGHIGRMVWYLPRSANLAFREFGIALFFAAVGLLAGPTFLDAVLDPAGLWWLLAGVCVTTIPLLIVGCLARGLLRINYVVLAGLISGSMTDPPALTFATTVCGNEAPALAYATVYPLTMLMRILTAQLLAVLLCGS